MNVKDLNNELEYHAALMRFEQLDTKKVQEIFDSLMNDGMFYDEFVDIAYPKSNHLADFIPSFEAALRKLNCNIPVDQERAVWVILKFHVRNITNGAIDPLEGLKHIMNDAYWSYDFHNKTKKFLGDSHGIEYLIGLYWEYDDMMERPNEISWNDKYGEEAIIEVKKDIVKLAQEWLKKRVENS